MPATSKMRGLTTTGRPAAPMVLVFVPLLLVAFLLMWGSPVLASGYTPDSPAGWRIIAFTEPAWSEIFQVEGGVLAVATAPADSRALSAHYDVYRLDGSGAAGSASTVLRDYVQGQVYDLEGGLILYGAQRPRTAVDDQIRDLYVRDLGSGAVTKLPMPEELVLNPNGLPHVDEGHVVWSQFGFQHEPEVILYDMATGEARRLSAGPDANGSPDIDGNDVVWKAWDGVESRVVHCDLSTGKTSEVAAGIPGTPFGWASGGRGEGDLDHPHVGSAGRCPRSPLPRRPLGWYDPTDRDHFWRHGGNSWPRLACDRHEQRWRGLRVGCA